MALEKKTINDKYEIVGDFKHLQIREAIVVEDDGVQIAHSWHRRVLSPDADISGENSEVQGLANVLWTQEIKDSYATHLEEIKNRP